MIFICLIFSGAQNKSAPPPPTEPATSEAPTEEVRKTQPVKLSFDYKDALNLVRPGGFLTLAGVFSCQFETTKEGGCIIKIEIS